MIIQRLFSAILLGAALVAGATLAHADRDAVQFGTNIRVAPGASVHDAVCFFCSVNVEGAVHGDVVVFFGDVHIAGTANHDVVNFFGEVRAEDNAQIGKDLVSMFGAIRLGQNVSIGKDMVAMFGTVHAPESVTVGNDRVIQPGWLLYGPLLLVGLVVFLIVREIGGHRQRRAMRDSGFHPWM